MRNYRTGAALALAALLLAACAAPQSEQPTAEQPFQVTPIIATPDPGQFVQPDPGAYPYPASSATVEPGAYPAPEPTGDLYGRAQTALQSLPIAQQEAASSFNPAARLYAIIPSAVMLGNLGQPPVAPGWFYRFKAEGSQREFIIQVVDGVLTGNVETEPIDPQPPFELPLNLEQVQVDSDRVFAILAERAPALGLTVDDPRSYDLELVQLEGMAEPVWNVFDPVTFQWVLSVSAVTGEEVPNPRG